MRFGTVPYSAMSEAAKVTVVEHPWLPPEFVYSGLQWWFLSSGRRGEVDDTFVLANPTSILEHYWNAQVADHSDGGTHIPRDRWKDRLLSHVYGQATLVPTGKFNGNWREQPMPDKDRYSQLAKRVRRGDWPNNLNDLSDIFRQACRNAARIAKESGIDNPLVAKYSARKERKPKKPANTAEMPKRPTAPGPEPEPVEPEVQPGTAQEPKAAPPPEPKRGRRNPTPEQQAVVDRILMPFRTVAVSAFAGSGKTTLAQYIIHSLHQADPTNAPAYVVYNAAMRQDADSRMNWDNSGQLKDQAAIHTFHSYALGALPQRYRDLMKSKRKPLNATALMTELIERGRLSDPAVVAPDRYSPAHKELAKNNRLRAQLVLDTLREWCKSGDDNMSFLHVGQALLSKPKITGHLQSAEDLNFIYEEARQVWQDMLDCKRPMSFDHYLKYFQVAKLVFQQDIIIADEVQDLNPVMIAIIQQQRALGKSIILLGDKHQAINGWNGANNSVWQIAEETRYLTVSHRVSPEVAALSNKLLQGYLGEETEMKGGAGTRFGQVDRSTAHTILSRTNAGVFRSAAAALMGGKTIFIQGLKDKDQQQREENEFALDPRVAKIFPCFRLMVYMYYLAHGTPEERRLIRDKELKRYHSFEELETAIEEGRVPDQEMIMAARVVREFGPKTLERIDKIQSNLKFNEADADVILTTVHKAKGLEWDQVVMNTDFRSLFNKNGDLKQPGKQAFDIDPEELRLIYVAITRGRKVTELNPEMVKFQAADISEIQPYCEAPPALGTVTVSPVPVVYPKSKGFVCQDASLQPQLDSLLAAVNAQGCQMPHESMVTALRTLNGAEQVAARIVPGRSEVEVLGRMGSSPLGEPTLGSLLQLPRLGYAQLQALADTLPVNRVYAVLLTDQDVSQRPGAWFPRETTRLTLIRRTEAGELRRKDIHGLMSKPLKSTIDFKQFGLKDDIYPLEAVTVRVDVPQDMSQRLEDFEFSLT